MAVVAVLRPISIPYTTSNAFIAPIEYSCLSVAGVTTNSATATNCVYTCMILEVSTE